MENYMQFLETKKKVELKAVFDVNVEDMNPALFDFQRRLCKQSVESWKVALFEDCGLEKRCSSFEWAKHVSWSH